MEQKFPSSYSEHKKIKLTWFWKRLEWDMRWAEEKLHIERNWMSELWISRWWEILKVEESLAKTNQNLNYTWVCRRVRKRELWICERKNREWVDSMIQKFSLSCRNYEKWWKLGLKSARVRLTKNWRKIACWEKLNTDDLRDGDPYNIRKSKNYRNVGPKNSRVRLELDGCRTAIKQKLRRWFVDLMSRGIVKIRVYEVKLF